MFEVVMKGGLKSKWPHRHFVRQYNAFLQLIIVLNIIMKCHTVVISLVRH